MKLGLGKPAPALIMPVTLDCAAAQWIPTRLANATDETSGELDFTFGKGWDSNVDGVENVPVVLRSNPFELNDNDFIIRFRNRKVHGAELSGRGCCAVHICGRTIDGHAKL
ncbi:hypothetical protein EDD15DRAFT_1455627 [Pisolithus albus]|nr:hypothetical protein EDD15DRAFT_1455627 [Pisolithus albus]